MADAFPTHPDDSAFRNYAGGALAPDAQRTMIGGTHNVSTKLNPQQALTGAYTPLPGDEMPAGAPIDTSSTGRDYLPGN